MKRKITPHKREESVQAVIDYCIDNGLTEFDTNILIHTNLPYLGGYRTLLMEMQEGNWDKVWDYLDLYFAGDLW